MFGVYLFLNGLERILIEKMRVNNPYLIFGIEATQAQLIAFCLMLAGVLLVLFASLKKKTPISNN
jgi:prolipoprotein diacylglyceryltransferase